MDYKNTAWYNETIVPKEMVEVVIGKNKWDKLENSGHFNNLDTLIKQCDAKSIGDIGCGAAEVGRVYSNLDYTGFDLQHIITNVSMVVNPSLNYLEYDAYDFDYSLFKKYDILLCNGFLSELINPLEILKKLLENCEKYLIIHRQSFSNINEIKNYTTYGKLSTPRSYMCKTDFNNLLTSHEIVHEITSEFGSSLLLKKI